MYQVVLSTLNKVKRCRSQQLGEAIFEDLITQLRCNKVKAEMENGCVEEVHGDFQCFVNYMEDTFARCPANGSHGIWRLSDLLDATLKAGPTMSRAT